MKLVNEGIFSIFHIFIINNRFIFIFRFQCYHLCYSSKYLDHEPFPEKKDDNDFRLLYCIWIQKHFTKFIFHDSYCCYRENSCLV